MSFRYRQDYIETGAIAAPDPWNTNHQEWAEEFNGLLDRDNLPAQGVSTAMLVANACNEVFSDPFADSSPATVAGTVVEWHDGSTNRVGELSFVAESDGIVCVEWSGGWSTGWVSPQIRQIVTRFRILVNGVEAANSGWLHFRRSYDMTYIVGAIPVSAGPVNVKVQAKNVDAVQDDDEEQPVFVAPTATYALTIGARELVVHYARR